MTQKNKEDQILSDEIRFAVIGRQLADNHLGNRGVDRLITEVMLLRRQEQDSADKLVQFAALARQVGDAARSGRPVEPLLDRLAELRRFELQRPLTLKP